MLSRTRIFGVLVATVLIAALVAGGVVVSLWAARQEPAFYSQALQADRQLARRGSDELLEQVAALTSLARRTGAWQASFTADQVNGWLAIDVRENHPQLFPPEIRDPRIELVDDRATIACRYDDGRVASVLSLEVRLYLSGPNEVALQICRARAGLLPLPLGKIIEEVEDAASHGAWRMRWLQSDGEPVAALQLAMRGEDSKELVIEELSIRDGMLFVAGKTGGDKAADVAAGQAADQDKVQR